MQYKQIYFTNSNTKQKGSKKKEKKEKKKEILYGASFHVVYYIK